MRQSIMRIYLKYNLKAQKTYEAYDMLIWLFPFYVGYVLVQQISWSRRSIKSATRHTCKSIKEANENNHVSGSTRFALGFLLTHVWNKFFLRHFVISISISISKSGYFVH